MRHAQTTCRYSDKASPTVTGIKMTQPMRIFAATAPNSFKFENHLAISEALRTVRIGIGSAKTGKEYKGRDRYWRPSKNQRDEGAPERREIKHRNDHNRMSVTETDFVKDEPRRADHENRGELAIVRKRTERAYEVAARVRRDQQKRDRNKKPDLG